MRKLGYMLLLLGFAGVMFHAFNRISHALWIAAERKKALPQQDSYSRKEIEDAILRAALATRESDVAAVLPGFLMLCGGVLLARASPNRSRKENDA